ncbi:hypothetical protein Ancab_018176 [Ancistrocladus abbreviatus]
MSQDDVDVNAHVSSYITSDDEWLSNDEVGDAALSCLSNSNLLGSRDESSDDIDFDDLKIIDKGYASDSDVDDDTLSYLCDLKANLDMSITIMKKLVMERYGITVQYMQLYRARLRAKEIINGSFSQSYS